MLGEKFSCPKRRWYLWQGHIMRENRARMQSFRFTSQSMFQLSPVVMTSWWWRKEWDCEYKKLKWASIAGWLDSALEIGWGGLTSGRSSEWSRCTFTLRGASWGDSGILSGCLEEGFQPCPSRRKPWGRPKTGWRLSRLVWEDLGVPPELTEVAREGSVWISLLKLMPPRPTLG